MPNFHPILFKICAYVNYMLIYKMHREGKFPKTITNLAALFLELFEPPSYEVGLHIYHCRMEVVLTALVIGFCNACQGHPTFVV